jgi:hypothetical protein
MDRWEQKHLRRILREEIDAAFAELVHPALAALAFSIANKRDTQGACGTAREAPTVAESTATKRVTDSAPMQAEAGNTQPLATDGVGKPAPSKRRPRTTPSAPTSGTDRAGGLGQDDVATAPIGPSSSGGADAWKHDPASIVTAHPFSQPRIPIHPRPSPLVRTVTLDPDRPIADSRESCARCGVRGDLGCAHQRPFGTQ